MDAVLVNERDKTVGAAAGRWASYASLAELALLSVVFLVVQLSHWISKRHFSRFLYTCITECYVWCMIDNVVPNHGLGTVL